MKKFISVLLTFILLFSVSLPVFAHDFTDIAGHWAEPEISAAFSAGIVKGDGNGQFRPNDTITRAEFFKMLIAALLEPTDDLLSEAKTAADSAGIAHWFAPYNIIAIYSDMFYVDQENAVNTKDGSVYPGIVEIGFGDNQTFPGVSANKSTEYRIERWEMAFMMSWILEKVTDDPVLALSTDVSQAAEYPTSVQMSAAYSVYNGIMKGDENGNLNLANFGTRAEATALINRLVNFVNMRSEVLNAEAEKAQGINVKTYTEEEIPKENVKVLFSMENGKSFTVELYPEIAPQTVANFVSLVNAGFYDGLTFHRVVDNFMAQGGDPDGDGTGGAEFNVHGEFAANGFQNSLAHTAGVISMARGNLFNSASSQFFICYNDQPALDGNYAAFGKVIDGFETVQAFTKVERTENASGELASPVRPIVIVSAKVVK
ncbi:MAG: peptidylprolyl isomerase [Clostridia bacterium]|nr:peptidylprolyl isomerase [Clostridia bacterium]